MLLHLGNRLLIGRHSDCKIKLPNDEYHSVISRYHCLLDINPPNVIIRDFGSLHGTYVNGKCIGKRGKDCTPSEGAKLNLSEYDLKDGDIIKLANTAFQVSIEAASAPKSTWIIEEQKKKLPSEIKFNSERNLGSIQGYTKLKLLGEGGCGEVYLARSQNETETKLVALKILRPQIAIISEMKERFLREARNTKVLNHPNLIGFDDYGEADGIFFFTMEYCDRGSVADLIFKRGGKIEVKEAVEIILQVLDGLHYAHTEKGLVHRDIKPGNILSTVDKGQIVPKLGDYGLAKAFDMAGLSGQTMTGTAMGTPHFMPRQQVLEFKYAQPDMDVWAVAASLYNMLTGKYPRDFTKVDPFVAILKRSPIPIRERNTAIPQYLAEVIDLALIDNPQLHFKTAKDFKQALLSQRFA